MPEQPVDDQRFRLNPYSVIAMVLWLTYALLWGLVGWIAGGILGFLASVLIGALLFPLVAVVVGLGLFYSLLAFIAISVFISVASLPVPPWAWWLRAALRGGIIIGCVIIMLLTVPRLLAAPSFEAWKQMAGMGLLLPASVIFSLYWDRLEKPGRTEAEAGNPS
ncbi:MAG: hypothetical protein ACLQGP_22170 [Isosphaeraceae bacterium]